MVVRPAIRLALMPVHRGAGFWPDMWPRPRRLGCGTVVRGTVVGGVRRLPEGYRRRVRRL